MTEQPKVELSRHQQVCLARVARGEWQGVPGLRRAVAVEDLYALAALGVVWHIPRSALGADDPTPEWLPRMAGQLYLKKHDSEAAVAGAALLAKHAVALEQFAVRNDSTSGWRAAIEVIELALAEGRCCPPPQLLLRAAVEGDMNAWSQLGRMLVKEQP